MDEMAFGKLGKGVNLNISISCSQLQFSLGQNKKNHKWVVVLFQLDKRHLKRNFIESIDSDEYSINSKGCFWMPISSTDFVK